VDLFIFPCSTLFLLEQHFLRIRKTATVIIEETAMPHRIRIIWMYEVPFEELIASPDSSTYIIGVWFFPLLELYPFFPSRSACFSACALFRSSEAFYISN
jgi:hypothetical protein